MAKSGKQKQKAKTAMKIASQRGMGKGKKGKC